jgi:hypothetical protein
MDAFCQKVGRLIEEEKFSEILSTFKSKSKTLNSNEIEYFHSLSVTSHLPIIRMLVLKLRFKSIRVVPDLKWPDWIDWALEFLSTCSMLIPEALHKQLFRLGLMIGEICADIGRNDSQLLKRGLKVLLQVIETRALGEITSVHHIICRLALQSKKLFEVQDLVNTDYVKVSQKTGVKGEHCVMFFYYIGSIALILKQTSKAYGFYEQAISVPCKAIHAASIESYKKLILLRLLIDGTEYHAGRLVGQKFNAAIRSPDVEPYTVLANFFSEIGKNKGNFEEIQSHIHKYEMKWTSDQNKGLIKKLSLAISKQKISKLTKVYSSLSFDQVVNETKVENAENILTAMVENNEIHAKINRKLKLVVFEDREEEIELDQIQDVCQKLIQTTKLIEGTLAKVILDKKYLRDVISCESMKGV